MIVFVLLVKRCLLLIFLKQNIQLNGAVECVVYAKEDVEDEIEELEGSEER